MDKTVFISHASEDRAVAERVCQAIEDSGIGCFIAPRDIQEGEPWPEGIMRGIHACSVLVLIFSSHSNQSGMVSRELEKAASLTKAVLPVRLEDVQPSQKMSFFIGLEHWVDATRPPIEPHLARVVAAVRRLSAVRPDSSTPRLGVPVSRPGSGSHGRRVSLTVWAVAVAVLAVVLLGDFAGRGVWNRFSSTPSATSGDPAADIDAVVERRVAAQRAREQLLATQVTDQNRDIIDRADLAWRMAEEYNQRQAWGRAVAQYSAVTAAADELRRLPIPVVETARSAPSQPAPEPVRALKRLGDKRSSSIGMQFAFVAPGRFRMGSPPTEVGRNPSDDERQTEVTLTRGYWMGVHLVTRAQFRQFVEETGYKTEAETSGFVFGWKEGERENPRVEGGSWRSPGIEQDDTHPVVGVSWNDAVAFCAWMTKKEKRPTRLPTEAEWEYACRAGSTTPFATGSSISTDDANFNGSMPYDGASAGMLRGSTTPVGTFAPNTWGLYDMSGNVWQWCSDWYGPQYPADSAVDPTGPPSGEHRTRRGGSYISPGGYLRSAFRSKSRPERSFNFTGFRVVQAAE